MKLILAQSFNIRIAEGNIQDYRAFIRKVHEAGGYVVMATDLLALTLLAPPGELGADVAIGICPAFWCADWIWRTACRIFCSKRRI